MSYFLWFVWGLLTAQTGQPASSRAVPSAIDAVATARQVEQLLQTVDSTYIQFKVDSLLRFTDKRVQHQYWQAGVKAWEKADFDGNGRTDLLVTGSYSDDGSKVLCLLDLGNGKLVIEPFDRQFYRSCPIVRVEYQRQQPLLRYQDYAPSILEIDSLDGKEDFLLTYKFGGFVEYNPQSAATAAWDSITYRSEFAYDEYEEFKLVLDANGRATYHSRSWPVLQKRKKRYEAITTQVTAGTLDSISALIAYIAPAKLKSEYVVRMNHVPYTELTIAQHKAPKIKLLDVGEQGAFGLVRLYELLRQLRRNQSWLAIYPVSKKRPAK
ncbi:hypothetical protein [Hymenobacter canadensis]|uniref:VCBS repeat-containing protein n=1 Tax=Hymenobacter canadensis TaxID=2999067 RepID=A0ABY7LR25_9BACT|nr:hypothetical protein [Hymenobacter canadensis]WBA42372.1 hypothetical protein O3303_02170 [Hymenobacter canadensis]